MIQSPGGASPWSKKAADLYDEAYARRYRAHDDDLRSSEPWRNLAAWLSDVSQRFTPPIDVLDLGCGTGRYFCALSGVRTLTGVDASRAMLEQARRPYRAESITAASIRLVEGDLLSGQFADGSFDLVYSIGVLAEHAPLTRTLLENIARWLRPGGRFAFTAVHPQSPSVPLTARRRVATAVAAVLPGVARRMVRDRLLSGGMYADETAVHALADHLLLVEDIERFTSEAHLHLRAVLRKAAP